MFDPASGIPCLSRYPKAVGQVCIVFFSQGVDRRKQFRRHPFIGVDPKYPVTRRHGIGKFMLVFVTAKLPVENFVRMHSSYFGGAVRRARVDYDDLIGPRHRFANFGNVIFLIKDDYRCRDFHPLDFRRLAQKRKAAENDRFVNARCCKAYLILTGD